MSRPVRVVFLNLNAGPHGEYGALLAAAVSAQPGVEVMSIIPEALVSSSRAMASLTGTQWRAVKVGGSSPFRTLRGLWETLRVIRAFKPDIIHEPVGSGIATILPIRPFLPNIAPLIVTEHNPIVHPGVKGRHHGIARALTRRTATRIHVHGPKAFAEMRALGVPAERLVQIRHGAFDEYGEAVRAYSRAGAKQMLVFGALRPNKGIDMLPEILERVRTVHPEASLLITGKTPGHLAEDTGGKMVAALEVLSRTKGVTVTDARVPEEDIPRLFGECSVCLLPYRTATQSGVAMIALASGTPLVATAVGDLPDIVEDGVTGLLAAPEPDAIAAKVIETFDDPAACAVRAEAGIRFAQEECAWPIIGKKMARVYREVLGRAELPVP